MSRKRGKISALREFRDQAERDLVISTLKRNNGNVGQSRSSWVCGEPIRFTAVWRC